jgi:Asp/Glu/hydantoin racemase
MSRVVLINPNASQDCTAGIAAAIAPLRRAGGPALDVVTAADGPAVIASWEDWHAAVGPICRLVRAERADAYVIACGSDPGIEAARAATDRPVLGIFRCAVATALARTERFGVLALASASLARHRAALAAMGVEGRLAGEVPLDLPMATLLDPIAAQAALAAAARAIVAAGAETVILGCTGMAHHRAAIEDVAGVPVIEPCVAAAAMAIGMLAE